MEIVSSREFLKSKGLKNPSIDSGISGGGDASRIYVSDVMKEYAAQFINLAAEEVYIENENSYIQENEIRESILNLKKQIK